MCVNADDLTVLSSVVLPTYKSPTGVKAWLQPLFAHSALATHLDWKYKPVFQAWWATWTAKFQGEPLHDAMPNYRYFGQKWASILAKLQAYQRPILLLVLPSIRYEVGKARAIADEREEILASIAQAKGVMVVRTEQAFIQDFTKTKQVGFGFMNSHLGTGHLNEHGHLIVARVIIDALKLQP